jgi:hypothetical protein
MPKMRRRKPIMGSHWQELTRSDCELGGFRVIFTETNDTITIMEIAPRGGIYE